MNSIKRLLMLLCAVLAGPGVSPAQHFDVLIQQINGQLVTGTADFDNNEWFLGRRVWFRDFDGDFAINNPGFNALASGSPSLPAGSQALPGNTPLAWDFLPMTIDTVSQNLFYWNGMETDGLPGLTPNDVAFGPLPGPNYVLSLFDQANAKYSVDGADAFVPGGVIDDTATDGSLHRHRFFFLEDGDGNSDTLPVDGIYLLAMQLKMSGLESALPIFMVFGTPGSSVPALDDAAVPWVEQQLDLPGDFNKDGIVDAADYVVWRKQSANQAEFDMWRAHFGEAAELRISAGAGQSASATVAGVPEPSVWTIALILSGWFVVPRAALRAQLHDRR